jgi:U3 small nucleolar ribonucleoprotein component
MSKTCEKCGKETTVSREEVDALLDKVIRLITDSGIIKSANINVVTLDGEESVNLWPRCECDDLTCGPHRMCHYADLLHDMADRIIHDEAEETDHNAAEDADEPVH